MSWKALLPISLLTWLTACASTPDNPDPYESFNRPVYSFNRTVDKALLKPVAQGYDWLMPKVVDNRIDNFFSNLEDISVMANSLLQGKFEQAWSDFGRFGINSTLGVLGLFDVATHWGLEKHDEDFGQTFAVWGWQQSAYLMLPFLGPSTTRDLSGKGVNSFTTSWTRAIDDDEVKWGLFGLEVIDERAALLDAEKILQESLDEYQYLRDAYLQRREYLIYDGAPPELPDPDEEAAD